ncbi:MAG TPA: Gfo/Idh/MocA family oxidoreductase [Tepidisphaeraceae bacterium]|jgi:hypothetical protein
MSNFGDGGGNSNTSRRTFIQRGSAAAAAMLGAPALLAAADSKDDEKQKAEPQKTDAKAETAKPQAATSAAATTQNDKLRVVLVGSGGQGRYDMRNLLSCNQSVVGLCDVDEGQVAKGYQEGGAAIAKAKSYNDYRKLLDDAVLKTFDAVLIGTPDHWHAPLCRAFIKAGKHVYCEKPLTHSIAEARELRELARANPKVATQMGNQGSAEASLRRSVELIRAGALGQVHEVHAWLDGGGFPHAMERPHGEDAVPVGFNWDFWCGPSPYRPFKRGIYHPFAWRGWFDFGNGQLADFTCHIFNTAMRSLELTYATRIEVAGTKLGMESYGSTNQLTMHFPARQGSNPARPLDAVTVHWYDGGPRPSDEILKDVIQIYKKPPTGGSLIIGEKGILYSNPWNVGALIKLNDDPKLKDVLQHEPTKEIPVTLPRKISHMQEWVNACKGQGDAWSDFDFGGHLTEIGLAGVMTLRLGHEVEWDGQHMKATNAPEADRIIRPEQRRGYLT